MTDIKDTNAPSVHAEALSIPAKSLYGLTPKVEDAIMQAVAVGEAGRVRALTALFTSKDMADLLGRISPKNVALYCVFR